MVCEREIKWKAKKESYLQERKVSLISEQMRSSSLCVLVHAIDDSTLKSGELVRKSSDYFSPRLY